MATAEPDYYCHKCQVHIGHVSNYQCPHCRESFIEEIDPPQSLSSSRHSRSRAGGQIQFHRSTPFGNATVVFGRSGANPRAHQPEQNDVGPFFQTILAQLFGGSQQMPFLTSGGRGTGNLFEAGNFDTLLTHLLNQMGENSGPAPAPENRIISIPTVKISREQARDSLQCAICMEEFKENEEAKRLPCSHHFHESCISTWLRLHGTCPTCRVTLEGDNTSNREYYNVYPNGHPPYDRGNNGFNSNLPEFD